MAKTRLAIYAEVAMAFELRSISSVSPEQQSWVWDRYLPSGAVSIVEGDPGSSKTTLLLDLAARISRGREMPLGSHAGPPSNVLIFSAEDSPSRLHQLLTAADADLERVHYHCLGPDSLFSLPGQADELLQAVRDHKASLVNALTPLAKIAQFTGAAVVLVRHLTKSASGRAIYRGAGSIALAALARSVLLIDRRPTPPGQRALAQVKSSWGPLAVSLAFELGECSGAPRLEWRGETDFDAQTLAANASVGPALHDACYVLYSILGDGALPVQAQRLATAAGVKPRTLQCAKELTQVPWIRKAPAPISTGPCQSKAISSTTSRGMIETS